MQDQIKADAWLETPDGVEAPILGACFIGRGIVNNLVLPDNRVSARHAMVHSPVTGEYWLIDLGSRNGTYVNGRRVSQPVRLQDNDQIDFPGCRLIFRHLHQAGLINQGTTATAEKTIQDIKNLNCWLMVADIEEYTQFIQRSTPVEVATVTGNWLAACKRLIEDQGGVVNKTLGDGFLAYWVDRNDTDAHVTKVLLNLKQQQAKEAPRFRVVAHYGKVFLGGSGAPGEESLLGAEVNFVFRMEKLASSLCVHNLLSERAWQLLKSHLPTEEECRHALAGFDGDFQFYTY